MKSRQMNEAIWARVWAKIQSRRAERQAAVRWEDESNSGPARISRAIREWESGQHRSVEAIEPHDTSGIDRELERSSRRFARGGKP